MTKRLLFTFAVTLFTLCASAQNTIRSSSTTRKISWRPTIPRPTAPAKLVIDDIRFVDASGDDRIDAGETFYIDFSIANYGQGAAYMIRPEVRATKSGSSLIFSEQQIIKSLNPNQKQTVRITGKSSQGLADGMAELTLSANEGNGFIPNPQLLQVACYAFRPPHVVVGQYVFTSPDGGVPAPNQVITLKMIIQNDGQSRAQNIKVDFTLPKNVYNGAEPSFVIGTLEPGEQRLVEFPFFANNSYASDAVTIETRLSESYGRYAEKLAEMPTVNLTKSLDKSTTTMIVAKQPEVAPKTHQSLSLISDVNENIPVVERSQSNIFALVIGNENYKNDKDIDVPFANSDASTFAEYMEKTIGIPRKNITLIHDATAGTMDTEIERLAKLTKSYNERGVEKAEIILYYAGHGLTAPNRDGYLLPVDIAANNVSRGIRTAKMYEILGASGSSKITVFIDACFSGESRGKSLLDGRGVIVEPNADVVSGNVVIFSATRKDQIAYAYNEKLHGMFTYFLLNKLKQSAGDVNYGELDQYLNKEVNYQSLLTHYTEQTPEVIASPSIEDQWHNWRLTAQ